jgi:hypothetical protein
MLEETYMRIRPKEEAEGQARERPPKPAAAAAALVKAGKFASAYHEGEGESVLARLPRTHWQDVLSEYHKRRVAKRAAVAALAPGMPAVQGQNNWTPLGPSVVARGQTQNRAPISGRVSGIAIAAGGTRVYVASANGGVWRSDDAGASWRSTMDAFDQNPTNNATTSLACGAIGIDPANPDRVYVGTGEGDTDALFAQRVVNALPSYRGIGPIRSDNGGATWVNEQSSPSLVGFSFFQIAVDPGNVEHCVAATTNGLYERIPATGGFVWQQRRAGIHTSVVVARRAGTTTWFAAAQADRVYSSPDGTTWTVAGTGFPASVGRITLGMQRDNPNVLYALIADTAGALHSVRRLDGGAGNWQNITGTPAVLPGGQGDYDLCVAVDPNNANLIYLGGDYLNVDPYPGSIWRCTVNTGGAGMSMAGTAIGHNAHADVHVLAFAPGNSSALYAGTDGGLFFNANPAGSGGFDSRNTGLATLCTNFLAQHPTEPAVLYVGLQDNGTAKCVGEAVWRHVLFADGGYGVVNWNDPFRVLLFANGDVYRATDGGLDYTSWATVTPAGAGWATMTEAVVGTPFNPGNTAEADIVALGAGTRVYISSDFGTSWPQSVSLPAGSGSVFALTFASATRIYAGTTIGRVFRIDRGATSWTATRIDNAAAGALPLAALITDIAVDRSDATLNSIYICLGGTGDQRHVWRYNGTAWQARSGTVGSGSELLDVEHNALQFDAVTNRVYVGADIGVWESADAGNTWTALSNGLPDAPVYDLQIHPTFRLMRAALHGRGVFEWKLDAPPLRDVELYIRDTLLDTGRGVNTDGRDDPSIFPTAPLRHYLSPNIKVDVPTAAGYQTPTTSIDFLVFNETLVDGSHGVATNTPPPTVHNRVYVEMHNRGRVDATNVTVLAAITNAATGLDLPAGYAANVTSGTPFNDAKWTTIGVQTIPVVTAGSPRIVAFDLPSTVLPLPASLPGDSHYCMVVFLHSAQDGFSSTIRNVDALTLADRKVGQKNLHIVEFVGVPPPTSALAGRWAMLGVSGRVLKKKSLVNIAFDLRGFGGMLRLVLPPGLFPVDPKTQAKGFALGDGKLVKAWSDKHAKDAKRLFIEAKYPAKQYELLRAAMGKVIGQRPLEVRGGKMLAIERIPLQPEDEHFFFLRMDLPAKSKVGSTYAFDVRLLDSEKRVLGGSRYQMAVNRK